MLNSSADEFGLLRQAAVKERVLSNVQSMEN